MMVGEYPCCDGPLFLAMPDRTPAYAEEACPHCGATVWHRFSRVDPQSFTESEFLSRFSVDREAGSITPIGGKP